MRWMVDRAILHHSAKAAAAARAAYIERFIATRSEWVRGLPGARTIRAELHPAGSPPTKYGVPPGFLEAHPELIPFPGFDPNDPGHVDTSTGLPILNTITSRDAATESEISPGSLYASGLIAAGGIVGLLGVCIKLYEAATDRSIPRFSEHNPFHHDLVSVLMFALLAYSLYYFARKPLDHGEN